MQFTDRLTIDRKHRTKDGYLRVTARAARSGVQQYLGREVDPEGEHFKADQAVNVYRPPEEVFEKDAVASFVGRPITDDHPSVAVTSENWRDYSRGVVGGAIKDGEWLRFDLALMDAALIDKVENGKRELSNGYACKLSIEDGTAPDGTAYQAVQRLIRGNHVAVVDQARAGPEARISDGGNKLFECCDAATIILNVVADQEPKPMPKKITLDGLQVDLSDESAVETAIGKLQGQIADAAKAKETADAQVATLSTEKATLDAKVVTLEKQLADATITPQMLRDAAKAHALVAGQAKSLGVTITDEMDAAAIEKAVVAAKLGDAAKDWSDVQIAASFATLTKDVKPADSNVVAIFTPPIVGDAEGEYADALAKRKAKMSDAWRQPASSTAA